MTKIFKAFISLILFSIIFIDNGMAKYNVNSKIERVFNNFMIKIERKLTLDKEIIFLENLNSKIVQIVEKKKLSSSKKKLLADLVVLSNEKIFELKTKKSLNNNTQKILESEILGNLRKELSRYSIPSFVSKLNTSNKEIIFVSDTFEFIENNQINRFDFSKYFPLKSSNSHLFKNKSWTILIQKSWKIYFIESWKKTIKIPYSKAYNYTKEIITKNKKYIKTWNNFYSYNFKNFTYLEGKYWFYQSDLKKNWLNLSEVVLYLWENKRYNFISNYSKVKLIHSDILYGVTDKQRFLEHLVNDKLHLIWDTDSLFLNLQAEINNLTKWKKQSEKIQKIYGWTLDNVSYTNNFNLEDKKIFSWILTYKNNDWVCEWYVKLASYALMFAWIAGTNVIRGDVIDATDFPKIGPAWLKIWNKYYDPTFDDPIWATKTKTYNEYKYFWLPRDLLYANRFDYWVTPEYLKTRSLNYRKSFVNKKLSLLSDKYQSKNYLVLQWVDYNKSIWLAVWEKIDISKAKEILTYWEVSEKQNWEIKVILNWKIKNITKLQYYVVTDKTIHQIFEQYNFKMEWLYLFKWKKKDWNTEYRVWFDVIIK